VSDSAEGWCAAGKLGASRVSIRMDDRTDGQRADDRTDGQRADDRTDGQRADDRTDGQRTDDKGRMTGRTDSGEASFFFYYM
jgi:hypothetical protein